jgi:valyl-tRNA synthetase
LQTSQGYIFSILQHFATKLWNITNFVMVFQAVMKFLLRTKFSLSHKWSIATQIQLYKERTRILLAYVFVIDIAWLRYMSHEAEISCTSFAASACYICYNL